MSTNLQKYLAVSSQTVEKETNKNCEIYNATKFDKKKSPPSECLQMSKKIKIGITKCSMALLTFKTLNNNKFLQ